MGNRMGRGHAGSDGEREGIHLDKTPANRAFMCLWMQSLK